MDNSYLKQQLALGDSRLESHEAIDKFCTVVHLTWLMPSAVWRIR